jgi:membrane protein
MAAGAYVQRGKAGAGGRESAHDPAQDAPKVDEKKVSSKGQSGFKAKLSAYKTSMEKHAWFRVLETTAKGFQKDKVTENAAAMTYYGVFSLFPLFLLFMSIAGLVMHNNEAAQERVMGVIVGLLPQGQDKLREVIQGVIEAKGTAAGFGILALLWGALGWFKIIDSNINEIWGVSKPRSFIKGNLFALSMVAAIGGVALASFGATAAVNFFRDFSGDVLPGGALLWQLVVSLLSLLTITGVFFVLYKFAPQRKIEMADVWPGALATAVIWELTRRLLAFYIEKNNMVSGYGPIGAAMALLFWIYIASIIILVGAELCYAIAKERRHIPVEREMEVVAPAGEQPTAKFAPQVGGGHYAEQDKDEPIKAEPGSGAPNVPAVDGGSPRPSYTGAAVAAPAWMSQQAPEIHSREEGKLEEKPIYLDVPLVALVSVCLGFFLGWFKKKEEVRA